jgi:putative transcriptional regulator
MGFVLNHLFPRSLNDLVEFSNSIAFPLFEGGPCGKDQLYFMHQRPDLIDGGFLIKDSIYLGGNFEQAIAKINSKEITVKDIKLFIGYCGWETNQLEDELKAKYWNIVTTNSNRIFSTNKMDFDNLFLCMN